jgi:hypothetical protein
MLTDTEIRRAKPHETINPCFRNNKHSRAGERMQ